MGRKEDKRRDFKQGRKGRERDSKKAKIGMPKRENPYENAPPPHQTNTQAQGIFLKASMNFTRTCRCGSAKLDSFLTLLSGVIPPTTIHVQWFPWGFNPPKRFQKLPRGVRTPWKELDPHFH